MKRRFQTVWMLAPLFLFTAVDTAAAPTIAIA
jgi:hypothetical protein